MSLFSEEMDAARALCGSLKKYLSKQAALDAVTERGFRYRAMTIAPHMCKVCRQWHLKIKTDADKEEEESV